MNISYERLRNIIRDELKQILKAEDGDTPSTQPDTAEHDDVEKEQLLPSPEKTKKYCRKYGFMNTNDWMKTVDRLKRAQKGALYKKA